MVCSVSNGRITDKLFLFETKRKKKEQMEDQEEDEEEEKEESSRFGRTSHRMEKEHGKKSTRICGKTKKFCCLTRHIISKRQTKKLVLETSKCAINTWN